VTGVKKGGKPYICSHVACVTKCLWEIANLVDVFEAWENQSTIASERDIRHVWSNETWTRSIGRQPRVPWYAKALAFSVAGYEFSPLI
jgi:hypothetical protein